MDINYRRRASDALYQAGFSRQEIARLLGFADTQRAEMATRILAGRLAHPQSKIPENAVSWAVQMTDMLLEELNRDAH